MIYPKGMRHTEREVEKREGESREQSRGEEGAVAWTECGTKDGD